MGKIWWLQKSGVCSLVCFSDIYIKVHAGGYNKDTHASLLLTNCATLTLQNTVGGSCTVPWEQVFCSAQPVSILVKFCQPWITKTFITTTVFFFFFNVFGDLHYSIFVITTENVFCCCNQSGFKKEVLTQNTDLVLKNNKKILLHKTFIDHLL